MDEIIREINRKYQQEEDDDAEVRAWTEIICTGDYGLSDLLGDGGDFGDALWE